MAEPEHAVTIDLGDEGAMHLMCLHDTTDPTWMTRPADGGVMVLDSCWLADWWRDIDAALLCRDADWPEHPTFPIPVVVNYLDPDNVDTCLQPDPSIITVYRQESL